MPGTSPSGPTPTELRDRLIEASEKFGTLISPRARLEHLSALLFLKRASDVFHEETEAAIEELGEAEDPGAIVAANPEAYHELRIPEVATWGAVRSVDQRDLGTKVDESLRDIATANANYLARVFDPTDFNNRRNLPPQKLADVLGDLHALGPLTESRVSDDVLGDAFLQVVDHFSRLEKPRKGEMFTPAPVARLGGRLLAPSANAQVHDPACGSAGLLLRVREEAFRLHGDEASQVGLFGQELKPNNWLIARMNTLFHGAAAASRIELGDTVLAPAFFGEPRKFDLGICNPPFELETNDWHEPLRKAGDRFGRIAHLPERPDPELVFVQHMVASLAEGGRMAVLLPMGALFGARNQRAVRRDLIEDDLVEAVIQMPKDMFYGSGVPVSYLVVNKAKPEDRRERVLFIEASQAFERIETFNILRVQDIDRIVETYSEGREEEGFSAWASHDEIRRLRYTLTVRRYVRPSEEGDDLVPLSDALVELDAARAEARAADEALEPLLADLRAAPPAE